MMHGGWRIRQDWEKPGMTKTVEDAKSLTSEKQVQMKVKVTDKMLLEAINNIRGAVMICYPMGLPDYDNVRQILEDRESVEGSAALEQLDGGQASVWCFSKELQRDKKLCDYVGKNDKTKVVAKLQKKTFVLRNLLSHYHWRLSGRDVAFEQMVAK